VPEFEIVTCFMPVLILISLNFFKIFSAAEVCVWWEHIIDKHIHSFCDHFLLHVLIIAKVLNLRTWPKQFNFFYKNITYIIA